VSPRDIRTKNDGKGWETEVTPATYSRNYNADFLLTKQDIKNIQNGKINDDILDKLEADLGTLDNHPDYDATQYDNTSEFAYDRAYDFLSTDTKSSGGSQGSLAIEGTQGQLLDTTSSTEYVVPSWAKEIVSDVVKYDDIITAITNAKQGKPSELSNRAMDALYKAGSPHLAKELDRYNDLTDRIWELNETEDAELIELAKVLQREIQGDIDGTFTRADTTTKRVDENENTSVQPVQSLPEQGSLKERSKREDTESVPTSKQEKSGVKLPQLPTTPYSTKGINEEYPNNKVAKTIQRDVGSYVAKLADALGYEFALDKKGKKKTFNGVDANIAPAGGDVSFKLFAPDSEFGIYVNMSYQPDLTDTGSYDAYQLSNGLTGGVLFRTTKKDSYSDDGRNNFIDISELSSDTFVNKIIGLVEARIKSENDKIDIEVQKDEQATDDKTSEEYRVSTVSDGSSSTEPRGVSSTATQRADRGSTNDGISQAPTSKSKDGNNDDGGDDTRGVSTSRSEVRSNEGVYTDSTLEQGSQEDNFEIQDELGTGGLKTKFSNNIEAIKIVQEIQNENYKPTKDDKKVLSQYVGWGGLSNAFIRPDGTVAKGWEREADILKNLLSDEQYSEARRSTQDAHYTSKQIVDAIWSGVKHLGFKGGKVLEPSVGVGNFFGLMPSGLKNKTRLYGVELDSITATIANSLYPKASIKNQGFQDFSITDESFSLAIGNPPFGSQALYDSNKKHLKDFSIHNYFFAKSLDGLESGGVLAMVVSNGLLDSSNTKAREYMASKANLVGAIRLPNNAFSKNANTEVTTDIIFLQKRYKDQESNADEWVDVSELNDTPINKYFVENQDKLLGKWGKYGTMYRGDSPALIVDENIDVANGLVNAISSMPNNIIKHTSKIDEQISFSKSTDGSNVRIGAMFIGNDFKLYKRNTDINGELNIEPATKMNSKGELVEFKDAEIDRIKGMIEVVSVADKLRGLMLDGSSTDAQINKARAELNKLYDGFVKAKGFLNAQTNMALFRDDVRSPFLLSLEKDYDKGVSKAIAKKEGKAPKAPSATKADIFYKRTLTPYTKPTKAENSQDALTISLSENGFVDFEYMKELTGKSEKELVSELDGFVFLDDVDGWVTKEEYLSGDVKAKYAQTDNLAYKKALEAVIPEDIDAVDIGVTFGAGWIPKEDMQDFISHITGDDNPSANYIPYNAKWNISANATSAKKSQWGTSRRGVEEILAQTANLAQMQVKDNVGTSAQPQFIVNQDETTAVQEKQEQIKEEFKDWIWSSADRRERLGKLYNDKFNNKALRSYDGSHIEFVGKSNTIDLRQHQKDGVWRVMQGGTTLFDHTVGTGKTFTAVASVMELRRTGKVKKPLVVVPNHLVSQWSREWMELYPNANILAPSKQDFEAKRRKLLMSRVATGDYDAVIIAHSQLMKIENDSAFEASFIEDEIQRIQTAIDMLKEEDGEKARSVKNAEKSKERLEEKLKKLTDNETDDNLNFKELGIDGIFVDEAHEFKNLNYVTGLQGVAGLGNPQGSKKAYDLFIKTQQTLDITNGNNVVFLTGTPISNTIAEMFTLQRYLNYKELKADELDIFDAWVKQYAEVQSDWELTPSGKYKLNTRLRKFNNMPELITGYKQFSDVVTREDIPALPIPRLKGGKPQNIVVDRSDTQAEYIGVADENGQYPEHSLVYRSENLPKGKPKKGDDNMLKIMGEARKVALDMRLIDPNANDNPASKVNLAVDNAYDIYKKWNAKKGAQLFFCDLSTPKGAVANEKAKIEELIKKADEGDEKASEALDKLNPDDLDALNSSFSVYDDIKAKLIAKGIPENEVAYVHDAKTDKQKSELFEKVKSGSIRILLGSTSKMGAGMNVQNKLVALHHLDVPWRPSDLEQREGRIIRQGNEFYKADPKGFEIEIFRYATKNTLDSMMWQTIEAKANFIEQLRAGNLLDREADDVSGEAVSAGEMKAMSSGNPLMLEDMQLKKDIKKLQSLKKSHDRNQYDLESKIRVSEALIANSKNQINKYKEDIATAQKIGKDFSITIDGKVYEKREEAGSKILNIITTLEKGKYLDIGSYGGFEVSVEYLGQSLGNTDLARVLITGAREYGFDINMKDQSAGGVTLKITNEVKRIKDEAQTYEYNANLAKEELPQLKEQVGEFKKADELDKLKLRQKEVLAQLRKKDDDKSETNEVKEIKDEIKDSYMKAPSKKEQVALQNAFNAHSKKNGYDEAGENYIPTYQVSGTPTRPKDGTITLGDKDIKLPTIDEPMNADSIRVYLSDIIGSRLYKGKIQSKSALGVYKRNDSSIRVKSYSDVEIMAHELAHYLDFFYENKTGNATNSFFRKEILKNVDEVKALSYTTNPNEAISEGFAEFVRLWTTNYNELNLVAPNMVKDFEAKLATDKELSKKMYQLQEGMHQYYYQGEHVTLRGKQGAELNPTAKKIQRSQAEIASSIRQKAIDKIHTIKRIEAKVNGNVSRDAINSPYKALQLVNGASSVVWGVMNNGVPTLDKLTGDISYSGKPLNEILKPITSVSEERVKLFSDYLVAKRASELMEQGRENLITVDEIDAGLKLEEIYPEFITAFNEYQEFNDGMLDFYVGMKLITSEQRANFKEMNKNYVPFHRVTDSVQHGDSTAQSALGKRLTGGTHSLGDIMENIVNGIERNVKESLISRGKSMFYEMLDESGMGGVYATRVSSANKLVKDDLKAQAKKIATIMSLQGLTVAKDGQILSGSLTDDKIIDVEDIEQNLIDNPETLEVWTHGHAPVSEDGGYIDSVVIDDKRVYFESKDKDLVEAMLSFKSNNYNDLVQGLMSIKNIMTWNITNNPLFYLTNFVRDTVSASVLSKNNFKPVYSSLVGAYNFVTKSKAYKEYMSSGAGYGTRRTALGADEHALNMLEVNKGWDIFGKLLSSMEYGADIFEYGTRVGDFILAQNAGKSNWQSAYEAREVSTDFSIRGANNAFAGFMATVPFMKAGINGIDKTMRRIFILNGEMKLSNMTKFNDIHDKIINEKIKLYMAGGMIAGVTLALYYANKDDERYKRLTRDQKLMYWHIFIGDEHYKIPRPYDLGFIFSGIPEIMADAVYTENGEDALKDFMWGAKNMFSVGDISGLFQPILEDMTNTNWTGAPIVPFYMQGLDDRSDEYFETTPLVYRKVGKTLGVSPIKTQHYVGGYLGLTAKMIEEATENILWDEEKWGARPFSRNAMEFLTYRFKGREVEPRTKWSEKYYELVEKASGVKRSFEIKKKRAFRDNGEDVKEYMSDDEKKYMSFIDNKLKGFNSHLSDIKKSIEVSMYDKKLSQDEKEEKVNDLYSLKADKFEELSKAIETQLEKFKEEK
jgi:N12 class adenine-specific DNA methylase/DNA-binding XRE family transcriptional regulator